MPLTLSHAGTRTPPFQEGWPPIGAPFGRHGRHMRFQFPLWAVIMAFSLSLAFCFEAPTMCVVMVAAGTAGGKAVEAVDTAGAGAADCTAAAEVVGAWFV